MGAEFYGRWSVMMRTLFLAARDFQPIFQLGGSRSFSVLDGMVDDGKQQVL